MEPQEQGEPRPSVSEEVEPKWIPLEEADTLITSLFGDNTYAFLRDLRLRVETKRVGARSGEGKEVPQIVVEVEGAPYPITHQWVEGEILRILGISRKDFLTFFESPTLLDEVVKFLIDRNGNRRVRISTYRGDIASVSDGDIEIPSVPKIWDVVRDHDVVGVEKVQFHRGKAYLRVVSNHRESPPTRVGDYSHSGVSVVVNGSVEVRPFVYTLSCTNGMQSCSHGSAIRIDEETGFSERAVLAEVRRSLSEAFVKSRELVGLFVKSDEVEVESPHGFLSRILLDRGVPSKHMKELVARFPSLEGNTAYEITNFITSYARGLNPRLRDRLEQTGGYALNVAMDRESRCSKCYSTINV